MPHGIYPEDFAALLKTDAGKQWEPSNGTEGQIFIDSWCCECERDKVMNGTVTDEDADGDPSLYCAILSASFRGEAKEWQYDDKGQPCCIKFVKKGETIPDRCPHTLELPLEAATTPKQEAVTAAVVASPEKLADAIDKLAHFVGWATLAHMKVKFRNDLLAPAQEAMVTLRELQFASTIPRVADHLEDGEKAEVDLRATLPACTVCDGTGDVHRAGGEWEGYCRCTAGLVANLRAESSYLTARTNSSLDGLLAAAADEIDRLADGLQASEVERLRAEQAAAVMPQIGPLLDAWDGMDNDTKAALLEDAPDMAKALTTIGRAMEGSDGVSSADPQRTAIGMRREGS